MELKNKWNKLLSKGVLSKSDLIEFLNNNMCYSIENGKSINDENISDLFKGIEYAVVQDNYFEYVLEDIKL